MQLSQTFYVLVLLAIFPLYLAHPTICDPCGGQCDKCKHGVVTTALCGIPECKKGPGDICGGPSNGWGVCGDGLICSCNKCAGCSLETYTCYADMGCLPHQNLSPRHSDYINRLSLRN